MTSKGHLGVVDRYGNKQHALSAARISLFCLTAALALMFLAERTCAENTTPVPSEWSPDGKNWYPGAAPSNTRQNNNPNNLPSQQRQTQPQQPSGPSQEEITRNAAADYADKQGVQAAANGDWDAAIKHFQDALKNRPGDAAIQKHLADAQQHKQAAFDADKQNALKSLKGISTDDLHLKSIGSDNPSLALKGLDGSSAFSQLKSGNLDSTTKSDFPANEWKTLKPASANSNPAVSPPPVINFDAMVVDARNVPSGLPKSVEATIPLTPAGDRVRKGFQAASQRDWKVALAWFQDALNHQPGDPALQQLVNFAQFSLDKAVQTHTLPFENNSAPAQSASANTGQAKDDLTPEMNEYMKQSLRAWAENNPQQPVTTSSHQSKAEDPAWTKFVNWLNDTFGPKKEKDPQAVDASRG